LIRVRSVRERFPEEGLFAEKDWLVAPEPFFVDAKVADQLARLGHWLSKFVRATNLLYRQSQRGIRPGWVAEYCEAGKPPELIEVSRKDFRAIPRVIRPDIILTEEGWKISELDSVPGGIGLTAWLNQTYGQLGFDVIGGAEGMIDGFRAILPLGRNRGLNRSPDLSAGNEMVGRESHCKISRLILGSSKGRGMGFLSQRVGLPIF